MPARLVRWAPHPASLPWLLFAGVPVTGLFRLLSLVGVS